MNKLLDSTISYIKNNQLDSLLNMEVKPVLKKIYDNVDPSITDAYLPEWDDLVMLHKIIRTRKVSTVLEFGCGFSTIVLADALEKNRRDYESFMNSNLRRSNLFEIHSVDNMPQYVQMTKSRLPERLISRVHFMESNVEMTTFNGRICTRYSALPNIAPDFVYLDGPSQDSARGDIAGISTRHADRLPMSCDLLAIEHFLLPGTFICIDGRTANARFLRTNFQRNWRYHHEISSDVHTFELAELPLGPYNKAQVDFCLGTEWVNSFDIKN